MIFSSLAFSMLEFHNEQTNAQVYQINAPLHLRRTLDLEGPLSHSPIQQTLLRLGFFVPRIWLILLENEPGNQQTAVIEIKDVKKSVGNLFVHKGTIKEGSVEVGGEVEAAVDAKLRQRAKVHHTATHLLQAALKKVIGQETSQVGSLVASDRLRFDFNFHRHFWIMSSWRLKD